MKKRYLPFTVPNGLKLLFIGVLIILVLILGYFLILYNNIQASKESGFDNSKQLVLEGTAITQINDVSRYHGNIYYHVITGETELGKSAIAYVPVDKDGQIKFYNSEDFITREQMLNKWKSECSSCELIGINLAIDKDQPLWELKYIDNKDRYVFEYFELEDGSSYEQFRLKRSLY